MKSLTKKSTYSLVVNSEDRRGQLIETAIYGLFILSAVFGMYTFVAETMSSSHVVQNAPVAIIVQS